MWVFKRTPVQYEFTVILLCWIVDSSPSFSVDTPIRSTKLVVSCELGQLGDRIELGLCLYSACHLNKGVQYTGTVQLEFIVLQQVNKAGRNNNDYRLSEQRPKNLSHWDTTE